MSVIEWSGLPSHSLSQFLLHEAIGSITPTPKCFVQENNTVTRPGLELRPLSPEFSAHTITDLWPPIKCFLFWEGEALWEESDLPENTTQQQGQVSNMDYKIKKTLR